MGLAHAALTLQDPVGGPLVLISQCELTKELFKEANKGVFFLPSLGVISPFLEVLSPFLEVLFYMVNAFLLEKIYTC